MHLVNDRPARWASERCVALPVVPARIDYNALHRGCSIVPGLTCCFAVVVLGGARASPGRVKKHFRRIKAETVCRVEWSVDPVSIDLAWLQVGHKYMPVMIGTVR